MSLLVLAANEIIVAGQRDRQKEAGGDNLMNRYVM